MLRCLAIRLCNTLKMQQHPQQSNPPHLVPQETNGVVRKEEGIVILTDGLPSKGIFAFLRLPNTQLLIQFLNRLWFNTSETLSKYL